LAEDNGTEKHGNCDAEAAQGMLMGSIPTE